jgi:hypothetical protein
MEKFNTNSFAVGVFFLIYTSLLYHGAKGTVRAFSKPQKVTLEHELLALCCDHQLGEMIYR